MHVKNLLSLKGKVILITGGEGLYGSCQLEALAEADGKVITASPFLENAQKVVNEMKKRGLDVCAKYVDQTDHNSIIKLKAEIKSEFGGLDIFVNNAVARPMKKYRDPLEAFAESMRINATGMFVTFRPTASCEVL